MGSYDQRSYMNCLTIYVLPEAQSSIFKPLPALEGSDEKIKWLIGVSRLLVKKHGTIHLSVHNRTAQGNAEM